MKRPLEGLIVLEFSQYLAGPSAGLRLADMGARVIKIERPGTGDACRHLSIKDMWVDESSLLFHTINRNKESFAADLKVNTDLELVRGLVRKADVITHNFRPGTMEKIGLDYASVSSLNPRVIYAEISGYGKKGPWKNKPGQDLLIQSISGLTYTTGNAADHPVPFGLAIADMMCGAHVVQGILAALIRRQKTHQGALVEVSLLESILDFQFELLTTYFHSGQQPQRSRINNGHSLLGAPYGLYKTADGCIAIAMMPLAKLRLSLGIETLDKFSEEENFTKRDDIKKEISEFLLTRKTGWCIERLVAMDVWVMPVMNWQDLMDHPAYKSLQMEMTVEPGFTTTRCPIRFNDKLVASAAPAPKVGEHTLSITRELLT